MLREKKDHPGVYVPPPLIYAIVFLFSVLVQRWIPLSTSFFKTQTAMIIGLILLATGLIFNIPALIQFIKTKNTIVTVKPATSLQTSGIYRLTRNPMYVSLLLFYAGIAFFIGNWWTVLLLPLLILVITFYVIRHEEKYLERSFGETYMEYKRRVRRWI